MCCWLALEDNMLHNNIGNINSFGERNMKYEEWKTIHEYCIGKPSAYEARPFGEYRFVKTNGKDEAFVRLCEEPDSEQLY